MGNKGNKSKKINGNNKKLNNNNDSTIFNQNNKEINLSKVPKPFFKNKKTFSNYTCDNFEIFSLKDNNNAFYLAFSPLSIDFQGIIIYKYPYKEKIFKEINRIKTDTMELTELIIKYFYNPLNYKEYLFVAKNYQDIEIYYIKSEKHFEFINKDETLKAKFDIYLRDSIHQISSIDLFEVIYNKYNQDVYVITSFSLGEEYYISSSSYYKKNIRIQLFKNDKLTTLKEFSFYIKEPSDVTNIIYEDANLKKIFILIIEDNEIKYIEIKQLYFYTEEFDNFINSEDDFEYLKEYFSKRKNCKACIIKGEDNINYFYIISQRKPGYYQDEEIHINLIIIDLIKRKIFKKIKFCDLFYSVLNWNNKYLIFYKYRSFSIFCTKNNRVITKYSNFLGQDECINSIKIFFSLNHNFYSLFINAEKLEFYITN